MSSATRSYTSALGASDLDRITSENAWSQVANAGKLRDCTSVQFRLTLATGNSHGCQQELNPGLLGESPASGTR